MSEYWRVKHAALIIYGSSYRCHVSLRINQKWRLKILPSNAHPYYTLERDGVVLDVKPEDFEQIFEEVQNDT